MTLQPHSSTSSHAIEGCCVVLLLHQRDHSSSVPAPALLSRVCQQQKRARKPRKEAGKPSRHSTRLATIAWRRAATPSVCRARQVRMKKLPQAANSTPEENMQRYLDLFKEPLPDPALPMMPPCVPCISLERPQLRRVRVPPSM